MNVVLERDRDAVQASSSALGLIAMADFRTCSYSEIRIKYCETSSCEVSLPCSIAVRISGIVASTILNFGRVCAKRLAPIANSRRVLFIDEL
jgi:hypothetical protein